MIRIDARRLTRGGSTLALVALGALSAGCMGEVYTQPVASPPAGYGTTAGYVASPQPDDVDTQVVYVDQPPVVDIESYPYVEYDGAPVYFVGGFWYRRGPDGWAYYQDEPRDLGREREQHDRDRDPRWTRAREAPRPPPARPAPPRAGVAEHQPEGRMAPPVTPPPEQRRPEDRRVVPGQTAPVPVAHPAEKREDDAQAPRPRPAAQHPPPAHAVPRIPTPGPKEPEHR